MYSLVPVLSLAALMREVHGALLFSPGGFPFQIGQGELPPGTAVSTGAKDTDQGGAALSCGLTSKTINGSEACQVFS